MYYILFKAEVCNFCATSNNKRDCKNNDFSSMYPSYPSFKGIVHPKIKILLLITDPHVEDLRSSLEHK